MNHQEEILDNPSVEEGTRTLHKASLEKRLLNYLLDAFFCGIAWMFFVVILTFMNIGGSVVGGLFVVVIFFGYPLYYFITEATLSGKSLAKYITGTRAVNLQGNPMNLGDLGVRCLCRMVPFERFSFLFNYEKGWHDRWSATMVIDEKKSVLPIEENKTPEKSTRYLK